MDSRSISRATMFWHLAATSSNVRSNLGSVASAPVRPASDDVIALLKYSWSAETRYAGSNVVFVVESRTGESRYSANKAEVARDLVSSVCAYVDADCTLEVPEVSESVAVNEDIENWLTTALRAR